VAAAWLGAPLTPDQLRRFDQYRDTLIDWNTRINLTGIVDPVQIAIRHFLDSLAVLRAIPSDFPGAPRVIDVGSGAGFPGLPLRIVRPTWRISLLEATGKKIDFLTHLVDQLDVPDVALINARAEDIGQNPRYREQFDLVLARAVAGLPTLVEYMLPLCKVGGRCIALKGVTAADELRAAARAIRILGGAPDPAAPIVQIDLPDVAEPHFLITLIKVAPSPAKYPRRAGLAAKTPLR